MQNQTNNFPLDNYMAQIYNTNYCPNFMKIYLSCNYVLISVDTVNSFNKNSDIYKYHAVLPVTSTSTPFTSKTILTMLQNHIRSLNKNVKVTTQRINHNRFRNTFIINMNGRDYIIEHITGNNGFSDTIKITYPDRYILDNIKTILDSFPHYHIQEIEFTFDFYLKDQHTDIYRQLTKISHLNYSSRSKPVPKYNTTKYANNIRATRTKGAKIYIKILDNHDVFSLEKGEDVNINQKIVVRQELTYKRNKLKRTKGKINNLGIDTIDDLYSIDPLDIVKPLKYKTIDYVKFAGMRRHRGKTDSNRLKEALGLCIDLLKKDVKETMEFMVKNNINKYQAFKFHSFHEEFIMELQGKSFLIGDVLQIDPEMFF